MGAPTIEDPPASLLQRACGCFGACLEWLLAAATIIACGMLFSSAFIPDARPSPAPTVAPPLPPPSPPLPPLPPSPMTTTQEDSDDVIDERTTTASQQRRTTSATRRKHRDLPEVFDTSDWREWSPGRKQPFLDELHALNFSRPARSSSSYRLSGADVPSLYEVHLNVTIRGRDHDESMIEGHSRTHFARVGDASRQLELHAFGLFIYSRKVNLTCDGEDVGISAHYRDNVKQSLIIDLTRNIEKGSKCVLELAWSGLTTTDDAGLYETWFTNRNGVESISLTTHGETMHTRKWMPCFDEPRYKTPWRLSVEHEAGLVALSNGRVLSTAAFGANRSLTTFEETWPLPAYLYTVSVLADYEKQQTVVDGLPLVVYVPDTLASVLPTVVRTVADIIPLSLNVLKAPHLSKKLDFVFVPDHTSAMENPGHISLDTSYLNARATFVHEMMHQYFGNLLTLDWWSDLWINEGLANYYEEIALNGKQPKRFLSSMRGLRDRSMEDDVYDTSLALHTTVNTFIESRHMFRNPYTKGAVVMHMLRDFVGDAVFDGVIEKLLNDRANATLPLSLFYDRLKGIGGQIGENAAAMARDFLEQANYPILFVRHTENATFIRQVRCHRGFVDPAQRDFDTRWTLPVYLLNGTTPMKIVIHKDESEIVIPTGRLIVDPSRVVNYRVVYERRTYEEIIAHKDFSGDDKELIESDLVEATRYGYTDPAASYDLLSRRNDYTVTNQIFTSLNGLFGADNEIRGQAKSLLEKLSGHTFTDPKRRAPRSEHPLRYKRRVVLENDYESEDDDENEESTTNKNVTCDRVSMKDVLIKYNKLNTKGYRDTSLLNCMFGKLENETATLNKTMAQLLYYRDTTYHSGDRLTLLNAIMGLKAETHPNFVQDFIVSKEFATKRAYYANTIHWALHNSILTSRHTEQACFATLTLKTLIAQWPEAAHASWLDIANRFEKSLASKIEATILGSKVIEALRKLTEE